MDAPSSAKLRAVDVDAMREWYQEQVERTSIRQVAKLCGIGRSSLHNFLNGASPHPRLRRLLAKYYLEQRSDGMQDVLDALAVLISGIEGEDRGRLQHAIVGLVEQAYCARGAEPPRWIVQLREA